MSEWILEISAQLKTKAENNKSVITTNLKMTRIISSIY